MLTGPLFLDHLADLLGARPAPGARAAGGRDVTQGGGSVGDDGANGSVGDTAADADDHALLNLNVTFKSSPEQPQSVTY
jgi:hypothetical protein